MRDDMVVGIAGGTGSGKSTVVHAFLGCAPNMLSVLYLDDYYKPFEEIEKTAGFVNWDSPQSLDFDLLLEHMAMLKNGNSIEVLTKNERDNPAYWKRFEGVPTKSRDTKRVPVTVQPRDILLLEGFLVLHDERVRASIDYKVFLDLDADTRFARRQKFVDEEYLTKVLLPMQAEFVEPQKAHADHIIDVSGKSVEEVVEEIFIENAQLRRLLNVS